MNFDWTDGPLAEGLRQYNNAEYFAAHETWEAVWITAPAPEKTFLQALIQVTAAFHHLERRNVLGACRLIRAALIKLEQRAGDFGGLSVELLRQDLRCALSSLESAPESQLRAARILPR